MADLTAEDRGVQLFWEQITMPEKLQISIPNPRKKVIVISGPTAVGKTKLSVIAARAVGGEIISADSMQVYRGMDIGTAKATIEERESIVHHLIDIRDVSDPFSVVEFWEEATRAIDEVHEKGGIPIVVGGTGFYLHALIYGPPSAPPPSPLIRSQLEKEWDEIGGDVLFQCLQKADPLYARTITRNDKHKIIRALEIIKISGRKVSDFPKQTTDENKYNFRCWFLHIPKDLLYRQIDQRCEEMLKNGLVDEVRALEASGIRKNSSTSQAIGYRQCLEYLSSDQTESDWEHLVLSFKQASRRYAKRQFTWFRKEPLFRWINREDISFETLAEVILRDADLPF